MDTIIKENNIKIIPSADGVEVIERGTENNKIYMLINHNAVEMEVLGETLAPFECKIKNSSYAII